MDQTVDASAALRLTSHESGELDERPLFIRDSDAETRALLPKGALAPLPKKELAVLCLLRLLDPLNFTQIFPYINELIWNLGVTHDPMQIGYYSGIVESVFAIAQLVTMCPWGVLSDTAGRRPVILAGAAGLTMTTLIFGLSQDFNSILVSRSLAGLFSGNVAVIPSVLCEITDKDNEALVYSVFGVFWPIGAIIGPMIGGSLSNPTDRFPKFFSYVFFKKYPYFLPCCVAACFSALGFILCYFFLKETSRKSQRDCIGTRSPVIQDYGATNNEEVASPDPVSGERYCVKQLLAMPIIRTICMSAYMLSFISTAFEVIFVLFCYSPIEQGGLGFSPQEIGFALTISGLAAALLSAIIMPRVLARFNHARLYHFSMKLWVVPFLTLPLLNTVARAGIEPGASKPEQLTMIKLWIGIAVLLAVVRAAFIGFSINMLLVKAFAPNPAALGTTYGVVQFAICLSRSFSPVLASCLYVLSHQYAFLGGNCWALVMVGFSCVGCLFSRRVMHQACKD